MNVKLFSPYNHFPTHQFIYGKPYVPIYNDWHVYDKNIEPRACALLIEPRTIQPEVYKWIEQNYRKFKYVFTHDSILLEMLPNAKLILWGGVWYWADENIRYNKTKDISFCSGSKDMCLQHIRRKEMCKQLEKTIDCMGDYDGGSMVTTEQIYKDYRFSVCIENYRDDWWFSEKICNAFSNKCVPIYYGARNIGKLFDINGIIEVDSLNDLPRVIDNIKYDPKWEYGHRNQAIDFNYQKVREYVNFETWFFNRYEKTLEDLAYGVVDC